MARSLDWYRRKVQAFRTAWHSKFGQYPSAVCCALAVSVAIHETNAGDAWPGEDGIVGTSDDENNWGATTLRSLNNVEQWTLATEALRLILAAGLPARGERLSFNNFRYRWQRLYDAAGVDVVALQRALGFPKDQIDGKLGPKTLKAFQEAFPGCEPEDLFPNPDSVFELNAQELAACLSIVPTVGKGHQERARNAMAVLRRELDRERTGYTLPQAVIHCDSTPKDGAYFVWFAAFDSPEKGAEYFIGLLVKCAGRAAVESDPQTLAEAMYDGGYYTGFHKPVDNSREAKAAAGQKNADAYAARIRAHYPTVLSVAESLPNPPA